MQLFLRSITYFREDLPRILFSMALIGANTLLSLLQPFPFAILIGSVLAGKHSQQWVHRLFFRIVRTDNQLAQIAALAGAMLLLRLVQELLQALQTYLNITIGYRGMMRVRCELFRKLQALSHSYHRSQPQGDSIYRLSYDTFGFQTMLGVSTGVILNAVTLVGIAWIMLTMNWRLTLVALSVAPLLVLVIKRYSRLMEKKSTEAHAVDSELTIAIQRSVSLIGLVQAFGREQEEYSRFNTTVQSSVRTWLKLHLQEVVYWFIIGMIFALGGAAIFGYGGWLIYKKQLELSALYVFLDYLARLYAPLNTLSGSGATVAAGMAGVKRVFEVLDRDPIIKDAPDALALPTQSRTLQLEQVGFEYRAGEPVLRDVSVTIPPGQMIGFVGSSGVGKTTLLNLLPRFYDPTSGALKLDNIDLRRIKLKDLRKHIAVVVQENVILPTTIAENIAYGRPQATAAQIKQAATMAGAATFIEALPDKYETQVSESGQNLSGGQRQRIAIARALLAETPILILDEPTSALDPQHEQQVTEMLRGLKRQRTIIVVSHRLSTVADCDQIYVMDEGRIVEHGTHDQLVAAGGLYFRMAEHQMRLESPAAELAGAVTEPGAEAASAAEQEPK